MFNKWNRRVIQSKYLMKHLHGIMSGVIILIIEKVEISLIDKDGTIKTEFDSLLVENVLRYLVGVFSAILYLVLCFIYFIHFILIELVFRFSTILVYFFCN